MSMHDTVIGHVDAQRITPKRRVTAQALEFAATWVEQYEGDDSDDLENLTDLATVAEWLRKQAAGRKH